MGRKKVTKRNFGAQAVDELLKQWDQGKTIWSIEMGGLGPGYEQAIQIAAVEFARAGKDYVPNPDDKKCNEEWDEICNKVLKPIDKQLGGITGAMYGAAKWLAWRWCHGGGPAKLIEDCEKRGESNRVIQVSKHF